MPLVNLSSPKDQGATRNRPQHAGKNAACGNSPPLSRAEHRRYGREKRVGLFERSEFRRAPSALTTRRKKRDTGVFFWFVFFHVEENEHIA